MRDAIREAEDEVASALQDYREDRDGAMAPTESKYAPWAGSLQRLSAARERLKKLKNP